MDWTNRNTPWSFDLLRLRLLDLELPLILRSLMIQNLVKKKKNKKTKRKKLYTQFSFHFMIGTKRKLPDRIVVFFSAEFFVVSEGRGGEEGWNLGGDFLLFFWWGRQRSRTGSDWKVQHVEFGDAEVRRRASSIYRVRVRLSRVYFSPRTGANRRQAPCTTA